MWNAVLTAFKNKDVRCDADGLNRSLLGLLYAEDEVRVGLCLLDHFADGEEKVCLPAPIGGTEGPTVIFHRMSQPFSSCLMHLALTVDAVKRSTVDPVYVVVPYLPYSRQDKTQQGEALGSKVAAKIIGNGVQGILTLDAHSQQIAGLYDVPVKNNTSIARRCFVADLLSKTDVKQAVLVAPDTGNLKSVRELAEYLGSGFAFVAKKRTAPGESFATHIAGDDVEGKTCIIIDDMIDGAGTVCNAAQFLTDRGATYIAAYATHGLFSGEAEKLIETSCLDSVTVCNTIAPKVDGTLKLFNTIDIAGPLLNKVKACWKLS